MNLLQIQELSDMICLDYSHAPVFISINNRLKRVLGRADVAGGNRVELSNQTANQPFEIVLSILIHELCHVFLLSGHTSRFFALSRALHKEYGIVENRTTKRFHGTVFNSENKLVEFDYSAKSTRIQL